MNTPTNNPMDDDHSRDVSGCIYVACVCLASVVALVLLIAFGL